MQLETHIFQAGDLSLHLFQALSLKDDQFPERLFLQLTLQLIENQKENFDRKIFLVLGYFFSSNEAKAVSRASFMLEKSAFISSAISRAVP